MLRPIDRMFFNLSTYVAKLCGFFLKKPLWSGLAQAVAGAVVLLASPSSSQAIRKLKWVVGDEFTTFFCLRGCKCTRSISKTRVPATWPGCPRKQEASAVSLAKALLSHSE